MNDQPNRPTIEEEIYGWYDDDRKRHKGVLDRMLDYEKWMAINQQIDSWCLRVAVGIITFHYFGVNPFK